VRTATALDQPQLYGLMVGLMLVAAITSGIFSVWLGSALHKLGQQLAPE
jgi:hypothetical protein